LPPQAQAAFEALRHRFLVGLPERWREIEDAPDDGARRAALHRLSGAAGSFGCPALGSLARDAEQAPPGRMDELLQALEVQVRATADTVR
jgi:HPt (histidine-containing phosphotransfer) domain-containing protein